MNLQVFLLVFLLILALALLCAHGFLHPGQSRGAAKMRTGLHRLLKPRSPDDCPACRLASPSASVGGPVSAPVRPWSEVKSRRGAPKRVKTEGFACPNQQCEYFGITEAHIHALVGDGKHGQAEQIQRFRCQACRSTFQPVEKVIYLLGFIRRVAFLSMKVCQACTYVTLSRRFYGTIGSRK